MLRAAEQPHAAIKVLFPVAAQADRHVGHRQHGRQQGALGRVEGVELVDENGTPREKFRVQPLRRALLAVPRVHGALGQQPLVGVVNERQLVELFPVRAGRFGVVGQHFRRDTGAFQLADRLGSLLAEGRAAALAAVVDDLVQQRVRRAAQQQCAARLGQRRHRRPAVTAQQRLRQRGEGVAFHIGGQAVTERAVEHTFRGGGELFRHDQDAALSPLRAGAQLCQHLIGFTGPGGAQDKIQHSYVPL